MKKIFLILLFPILLGYYNAFAQPYSSTEKVGTNARFTIDQKKGCAPLSINISVPKCDGNNACYIVPLTINDPVEDISFGEKLFTLPYKLPGFYKLTVFFNNEQSEIEIEIKPKPIPDFEVFACNVSQVFLNIKPGSNYDKYQVTYQNLDLNTEVLESRFSGSYSKSLSPKTNRITIQGQYDDAENTNCGDSTQSVNVQSILPALNVETLSVESGTQIKLDFPSITPDQRSVLYKLKIGTNTNNPLSFQSLQNIHNQNFNDVNNGINPNNNYYCFQMTPFDKCTNSLIPSQASNIICSAKFDAVANNNQNDFSWVTSTDNINDFTINKSVGTSITGITSPPFSAIDNTAKCGDITYKLISNYNYANGAKSISLPRTVTSFSNDIPLPIENITSVVNEAGVGVDLSWLVGSEFKTYYIVRANNVVGTSNTEQFTDNSYTTEGEYCYQIKYENNCNVKSNGEAEACPIRLTGIVNSDNSIKLSWNKYTGWKDGVTSYIVKRRTNDSPYELYATISESTTDFLDSAAAADLNNQRYQYIIIATTNVVGLGESVSNSITLTKEPNIFYPTAFTPNGNGQNDEFRVFGQYISKFEMNIFNRWGELMFHTTNISQTWDGNFKDNPMPEGTYVFVSKITDLEGRDFKKSGSIVLLKRK